MLGKRRKHRRNANLRRRKNQATNIQRSPGSKRKSKILLIRMSTIRNHESIINCNEFSFWTHINFTFVWFWFAGWYLNLHLHRLNIFSSVFVRFTDFVSVNISKTSLCLICASLNTCSQLLFHAQSCFEVQLVHFLMFRKDSWRFLLPR